MSATEKRKGALLWGLTFLLLLAACAFGLYWFFVLQYEEYTDDAYVNGNLITLNPVVPGSVIAFYADDTDLVEQGQLIVALDPTNYQIAYEKELAAFADTLLKVRQLYDTIRLNETLVENKRTLLARARYDYENRQKLIPSKAVSNEDYIHAKDSLTLAELELEQSLQQLKLSKDATGETAPEKHPLIVQQTARVRAAYYQLHHCNICAPVTGYVAKRAVEVGQSVSPATPLMAIIPRDYFWVDANFKETQLSSMRIGQPATVWLDLYGSKVVFKGKVLGIASGTGSVFSLIPPQNATGNWIKIVQRLPVRVSLDPELLQHYPARLGLSAEVEVDITNRDLPILAEVTTHKPLAITPIFELDFSQVDSLLEEQLKASFP